MSKQKPKRKIKMKNVKDFFRLMTKSTGVGAGIGGLVGVVGGVIAYSLGDSNASTVIPTSMLMGVYGGTFIGTTSGLIYSYVRSIQDSYTRDLQEIRDCQNNLETQLKELKSGFVI